MAKRKQSASQDSPSEATTLRVSLADAETQLRERVEKGAAILALPINDKSGLDQAQAQYFTWDEYNSTLLKRLFTSPEIAQEYAYWGIAVLGGPRSLAEDVQEFRRDVLNKQRRLESIIERLPLYAPVDATARRIAVPASTARTIIVVHGRNDELKETVARFLGQLDLKPVILHEQPSGSRTIIEKFEAHSDACFAVVLLTPDDVGRLATDAPTELQSRARQNVIFEWGFFVAKLGRRNVCALCAEGVEVPSDLNGVIYVELDRKGAWKMLLARELKAGGVVVDLNRAI